MAALSRKQLIIIAELEKRVQMCREFMNDWLLFNQILSAYPSPGVNKAQLENQFLKIKSKLAREHRVLKDALQTDYNIDTNTMNIVSGATNLESIYGQSEVAVKKMQTEWHRAFISINETLGSIEDKLSRAQAGQRVLIVMPGQELGGKRGMSPKTKKNLTIIIVLLIILGVALGVPQIRALYVNAFKDLFK